jgi:hypothetical protein
VSRLPGLFGDHPQVGQEHLAVSHVKQLEFHFIQTQGWVGLDENLLVRVLLQAGQ